MILVIADHSRSGVAAASHVFTSPVDTQSASPHAAGLMLIFFAGTKRTFASVYHSDARGRYRSAAGHGKCDGMFRAVLETAEREHQEGNRVSAPLLPRNRLCKGSFARSRKPPPRACEP